MKVPRRTRARESTDERQPAPGNCTNAEGIRASAEKILRAFNTWAFKREQPSDVQLMLDALSEAVATRAAIPFVLYWGKGPRHSMGAPEMQCLDFLAAVATRIKGVHAPGAAMTLDLDRHPRRAERVLPARHRSILRRGQSGGRATRLRNPFARSTCQSCRQFGDCRAAG